MDRYSGRGGGFGSGGRRRALTRLARGDRQINRRLIEHFTLEDPHLDADDAVGGAGFRETVVDVRAERVQRNATFAVPLRARDFAAVQAARHTHLHAQGATAHGAHHGALHGAAEHHALLDLLRDAVRDQLRVELRLADLADVEAHVVDGHAEQLRRLLAQLLDVLTLLADDDAGARGLDGDVHLLRGTLDRHAADRSVLETRRQELAHAEVRVHVRGKLLLGGVPLR